MRFCVFDISNLIYRVALVETQRSNADPKDAVGLALATAVRSMRMPFTLFGATHLVACFDHYSWRRDYYEDYKANRRGEPTSDENAALKTTIIDAIGSLRKFLDDGTNVTVLHEHGLEADDFVARFTAMHTGLGDDIVIVSTDSDFKQLVSDKVWLYNPTSGALYIPSGVYELPETKSQKMKGLSTVSINGSDWIAKLDKSGAAEKIDPRWEIFEKIMRGDKTDNVPGAAVPRTRTTALQAAFTNPGGPAWQDVMLAVRKDIPGSPTVKEVFEKNKILLDLSAIPENVREIADGLIADRILKEPRKNVLIAFANFCREWGMVNLLSDADRYVPMLNARYR